MSFYFKEFLQTTLMLQILEHNIELVSMKNIIQLCFIKMVI